MIVSSISDLKLVVVQIYRMYYNFFLTANKKHLTNSCKDVYHINKEKRECISLFIKTS